MPMTVDVFKEEFAKAHKGSHWDIEIYGENGSGPEDESTSFRVDTGFELSKQIKNYLGSDSPGPFTGFTESKTRDPSPVTQYWKKHRREQ